MTTTPAAAVPRHDLSNHAFIDGQNLYMNTKSYGWKIDLVRFRTYLREKYNVSCAYYFLGVYTDPNKQMYDAIQSAGYTLVFREHSNNMIGKKKGNVDTDIVFVIMQALIEKQDFNGIVLVSGDGDYFKMVNYLIQKNRFTKLLAPNKRSMSSLYRPFAPRFTASLDSVDIKRKISQAEYKGKQKTGSS